jgi:hypothetical protein
MDDGYQDASMINTLVAESPLPGTAWSTCHMCMNASQAAAVKVLRHASMPSRACMHAKMLFL